MISLPRELYEGTSGEDRIVSESKVSSDEVLGWRILEIKYGNGIQTVIEGADFPQKGYAPPEAVWATNIVKRLVLKGVEVVNSLRSFNKIIENFTDIGLKVMSPYFLKYQYLTAFSQEIHDLTTNFLILQGLKSSVVADNCGKIIAHLFEYDNAYRLRLEDLFSETSKEKLLANPRKEIQRLVELDRQRENQHGVMVSNKFKALAWIMSSLILMSPKIRQSFKKAIEASKFEKLQLDNVDKYWACHRTDYLFMGMTYEERGKLLKEAGFNRVEGLTYKI